MKTNAFKVRTIWGGKEYFFYKISKMCAIMGWKEQQFRNHRTRHKEDKEGVVYKDCTVEDITIE